MISALFARHSFWTLGCLEQITISSSCHNVLHLSRCKAALDACIILLSLLEGYRCRWLPAPPKPLFKPFNLVLVHIQWSCQQTWPYGCLCWLEPTGFMSRSACLPKWSLKGNICKATGCVKHALVIVHYMQLSWCWQSLLNTSWSDYLCNFLITLSDRSFRQ